MTEKSRVKAVGSIGLDELLLDTKLAIPPPRAGFVSRADLVQKARTANNRVVAITAPAGYGKSSLLAQWAAVEDRPVVWVTLDKLDDDPVTLLSLVAAGYARATGTSPELVASMRGNPAAALDQRQASSGEPIHGEPCRRKAQGARGRPRADRPAWPGSETRSAVLVDQRDARY